MTGRVYLVGAGPGDPELITVKGRRLLGAADVVVYDRLANPALLDLVPSGAERVYVGKKPGDHALRQEAINSLLIERARRGLVVVRLKGGDPFVFGRGGEEAEALAQAGVAWEYVPGVTSAVAVPGYAGIPVTHRALGSHFTVLTAHEDPAKAEAVRWSEAALSGGTLVILMGAGQVDAVTRRLMLEGLGSATPAALVSRGTWPDQTSVHSTLATVAQDGVGAGCNAPAVLIVGETVALGSRLNWFESLPLFGCRVIVTRPADQSLRLAELIRQSGGEVVLAPVIRTAAIAAPKLHLLDQEFDWVVYTSVNGVDSLKMALQSRGLDFRRLGRAKIAAVGPETARAAEAAGLFVDFVPSRFVAEALLEEFPQPAAGLRILIPSAARARDLLLRRWTDAGAAVVSMPLYTTEPEQSPRALRPADLTGECIVTFTSSSTVENWMRIYPHLDMSGIAVACIGPITAATARKHGLRVAVEAAEHSAEGLVSAIEIWRRGRDAAG